MNSCVGRKRRGRSIRLIYKRLFRHFGPQHWWPGESPFEVAVGAILTQNTAWANASKAVGSLKDKGLLNPSRLNEVPTARLASLIRSSGYYNQKAQRLKSFVRFLIQGHRGKMDRMASVPLGEMRRQLLQLPGVGPETADSILLYGLGKPIFVVDAYTRRVLARHSLIPWDASYEEIQQLFMRNLTPDVAQFNEYHALIVALGKTLCKTTHPKCEICPLKAVGRLRL